MLKQILRNKFIVVTVLLLAFTVSCSSNAFAWGREHGHYRYSGGHWNNSGWFWGFFATGLAVGAIVATLPPHYEIVYINNAPYYYYDNVYYRRCPSGYVVVPEPIVTTVVTAPVVTMVATTPIVTQPKVMSAETTTINIPNASGGYTPVILIKHNTGYIGPQGEYYEGNPTVGQLKVLYGK